MTLLGRLITWLRRSRAVRLELAVEAAAEERLRGHIPLDASEGEVHPQHNPGQHA